MVLNVGYTAQTSTITLLLAVKAGESTPHGNCRGRVVRRNTHVGAKSHMGSNLPGLRLAVDSICQYNIISGSSLYRNVDQTSPGNIKPKSA